MTGSTRQNEQGDIFMMRWNETGGPRVTPPIGRGFGMLLIERGLKQGTKAEVEMDFATKGAGPVSRHPRRHPHASVPIRLKGRS